MKLIDLAIRRRVTIAMFTVAILLFGVVSLSRLAMNLLPDLTYPTLTVRTEYLGAAPAEVENLISKPVEEVLGVVKNVVKLESISRTGQSDVVMEFAWGTDMDQARLDVREKLDALILPLESERPVILRFDPSLDPILRYGLYLDDAAEGTPDTPSSESVFTSAGLDAAPEVDVPPDLDAGLDLDEEGLKFLRRFGDEQLKKELESTPGVAAVKVSGGLEDEVQVLLDPRKLAQFGLTPERIVEVLRAENVNLSGGRLEEGTQQFLVRTVNEFETVGEIEAVIIDESGPAPIYMRDVATVQMGYKEREAITRINGREAVEIAIYKEGDANTVSVARSVVSRLDAYGSRMPDEIEMTKVYDQSTFIKNAVDEVMQAGLIGGLLAILILYLFLRDFRTTVIISVSIPVSIIATFNLMYGYDLSLNIMSLGGLALGIGLLVDNSIVVLENIARHREEGLSTREAAGRGAGEVARAVIASTLTTVAVFFPLVFVEGIAGQLFRDQALTVTFSLLASLLVAITLIPMLASMGGRAGADPSGEARAEALRPPRTAFGRGLRRVRMFMFKTVPVALVRGILYLVRWIGRLTRGLFAPLAVGVQRSNTWLSDRYPIVLDRALRHKGVVLGVAFALLALTGLMLPGLGIELIPQLAQGEFKVEFRLEPGTPLERTDGVLARIQETAREAPEIQSTFAVAGTGNRMDANPDQGGENWGEIHVALDPELGARGEPRAMATLRNDLEQLPGLQYEFSYPTLFTFDTPVEIVIAGYNLDDLKRVSQALAGKLSGSPRFADVKSTMESGNPEVQIYFDRERAAALGVPVHTLAERVVKIVRGDVATRYNWRDRKIDVLVRAREEDRASVEQLRNLVVNPESERPIPLEAVADVVIDVGPGEIRRIGQERVALVSANLNYGDLGAAVEEIDGYIADTVIPAELSVELGGQSEEMDRSFRSLLLALLLAVFLVYLIMASQFESLLHPFVIFFSIPLALVGATWALWLTGSTVSVVVFIGVIMLAGIVVNNAIVLVDLINQLREQGLPKETAILEAGRLRLRPILMTTLTTALGLLPMAIGFGEGAEIRAPMAITVIGGLLVSTVLTLVVIPVMYALLDRRPDPAPSGAPDAA